MTEQIIFRPARLEDFEAVLDLACQLAKHIEAEAPPLTIKQFDAYYLDSRAPMHLLLAVNRNRVIGMISWTLTHELYSADTRVYISDLSIDKTARGRGIGTALMKQVIAWAKVKGVDKLGWDVWRHNATAKVFYEGMGGRVDNEALSYVLSLEDQLS